MSEHKYSFKNDYSELAHPRMLDALASMADAQFEGYGLDEYSLRAAELIKKKINDPAAEIHFLSGGTQANQVVIAGALRPYEAVIACESGHISTHEAGAIEVSGHKICAVRSCDGKLTARQIKEIAENHTDEHMVKPKLVFISQSTEAGTVYAKEELKQISECCRGAGLILYIDGARLGAGMCSNACDLSYADLADMADVFYIGGTKNGALFGEAVVICGDALKQDFRYHMKQRGALLAKGAAIGAQFEELFRDGLYEQLAEQANRAAMKLADGIKNMGYGFLYPAQTNQIFPIFPDETVRKMHDLYGFYDWQKLDGMTAVRLIVSWAAKQSAVDEFLADLAKT